MNIKTVILPGGLELIADVEAQTSAFSGGVSKLRLNRPFKIEMSFPVQETDKGMQLIAAPQMVPLMVSSIVNFIEVDAATVIVLDTNAKFEAAYVKRNTGLTLARA